MTRLALVLTVAALMALALCTGSGSATCAGASHHHRTSVVRVERCAAAGFRTLVDR